MYTCASNNFQSFIRSENFPPCSLNKWDIFVKEINNIMPFLFLRPNNILIINNEIKKKIHECIRKYSLNRTLILWNESDANSKNDVLMKKLYEKTDSTIFANITLEDCINSSYIQYNTSQYIFYLIYFPILNQNFLNNFYIPLTNIHFENIYKTIYSCNDYKILIIHVKINNISTYLPCLKSSDINKFCVVNC